MSDLMIHDLEASQSLDREALRGVRGGQGDLLSFNAQMLSAEAQGGIAAITTATQTLVNLNTALDLNVSPQTNILVGGLG
jgi:hypothetical protein